MGSNPVYLSSFLLSAYEPGDQRRVSWVGSKTVGTNTYYYPFKYESATFNTPVTEYLMVLRLAEQFLIRAEARAQQSNLSGAASDLNMIRNRAGLTNTTATTQADMLTAIYHERQVELFTEWGHRWLDMKRIGNIDAVMGGSTGVCQAKGGTWNTDWQWYPLPLYDLQQDANLVQNAGY